MSNNFKNKNKMATIKTVYLGQLRTEMVHIQSGNKLITDAPVDNNGKGEYFSPTDTVAGALGSCMLTIMGMKAESLGVNLIGAELEITKVMYAEPRRIGEIHITFTFPEQYDQKTMTILQRVATTCPVYNSLHTEIKKEIKYTFKK